MLQLKEERKVAEGLPGSARLLSKISFIFTTRIIVSSTTKPSKLRKRPLL